MSPACAARLSYLRDHLDAEIALVADREDAILVRVSPEGMATFHMLIDPMQILDTAGRAN